MAFCVTDITFNTEHEYLLSNNLLILRKYLFRDKTSKINRIKSIGYVAFFTISLQYHT